MRIPYYTSHPSNKIASVMLITLTVGTQEVLCWLATNSKI